MTNTQTLFYHQNVTKKKNKNKPKEKKKRKHQLQTLIQKADKAQTEINLLQNNKELILKKSTDLGIEYDELGIKIGDACRQILQIFNEKNQLIKENGKLNEEIEQY